MLSYLRLLKNLKINCHTVNSVCKNVHSESSSEVRKTLIEILDISHSKVTHILKKYPSIQRLDKKTIYQAYNCLQKFNVDKTQIINEPQILAVIPITIENRCMLLEEFGYKTITTKDILKYLKIIKRRVSLLKAYGKIDSNVNLSERLYSYLEPPPERALPLPKLTDQNDLYEVYSTIRRHYLCWKLEFADEESFDHVLNTYVHLKHKSFRLMKEALQILENEIGFTKERIRNNSYLIHSYPPHVKRMLTEIKEIGGRPIKEILLRHPKIIMTNPDTLLTTLKILKDNNIPDEAIQRCYPVFTLSSKSILSRLLEHKDIPEFNALSANVGILKLVNHQRRAKERLEYLQKLKIRNASLYILSATDDRFEKYVTAGVDRTRGDDIVHFLESKFDNCANIRQELTKHPFWFHVPLVQVSETYEYLSKKYNPNDLRETIQILLYPKEKIIKEMHGIRERSELIYKWLSPVQELNLCLYYIEKPHHFSGDGIWLNDAADK